LGRHLGGIGGPRRLLAQLGRLCVFKKHTMVELAGCVAAAVETCRTVEMRGRRTGAAPRRNMVARSAILDREQRNRKTYAKGNAEIKITQDASILCSKKS
jgi:hypothetical protein